MNKILLLLGLVCCLTVPLTAQQKPSSYFGAKLLFIDYERANNVDEDLQVTNGAEISYVRSVNNFLNFGIPLKVGLANVPGDLNNRNVISADAIVQLQLMNKARLNPYLFGGGGIAWEENASTSVQFPLGAGLKYRLGKNSFLTAQGEYRTSMEENRNNIQLGVGVLFHFSKTDTDEDGVVDALDRCPELPGPKSLDGCPDRDKDGIADVDDLCPDEAGIRKTNGCPDADADGIVDSEDACPNERGPVSTKGCPDSDRDGVPDANDLCPEIRGTVEMQGCPDRDKDGVPDGIDKCPTEPGSPSNEGCPIRDADGDGVDDGIDACPNQPGSPAARGCPDQDGDGVADKDDRCPTLSGQFAGCPDTDGDGVIDADDRCPNQAGSANNKGCPQVDQTTRETLEFAMSNVRFETGRAKLRPASYDILNQIVGIMNRYPGYSLSIEGHTDNTGSYETNQRLSEDRARSCYQYLLAQGVSATRMRFVGFGENRPIADNNTSQGRRLNRRVEFNMFVE